FLIDEDEEDDDVDRDGSKGRLSSSASGVQKVLSFKFPECLSPDGLLNVPDPDDDDDDSGVLSIIPIGAAPPRSSISARSIKARQLS
ncbi:unnamed protein product, partial [Polarella glacialis]